MIRRLTTAIRRLTRRQPTPPSEPHSRYLDDVLALAAGTGRCYGIDCDVDAAYDQPGWPGQRTPGWFQSGDPCHCHGADCTPDCETCHGDVLERPDGAAATALDKLDPDAGPDDGAVPAEVRVPAVPDPHPPVSEVAAVHRPDIVPRGWRFWRRTQLDADTREWLDGMKAPVLTVEERARDLIQQKEDRDWTAEWYRVRWVLAERTEEMRVVLVGVEGKLLAGAR